MVLVRNRKKNYWQFTIFAALLAIAGIFPAKSYSQELIPLNNDYLFYIEGELLKRDPSANTSVKPIDAGRINWGTYRDSLLFDRRKKNASQLGLIHRKLRFENLIKIDSGDFHMTIDPLFNFEFSKQADYNQKIYTNTRGVLVQGSIGKNFWFTSDFRENQSFFNEYTNAFVKKYNVVPGQGFVKAFKTDGFDYAASSGLLSYSPGKYFNFQFGHGKNFIGEGYRSLLLSDASFNYPYLKITTNIWKIQYTNLYASFIDLKTPWGLGTGYSKKFGTFHFLNYKISNNVHIGLFEAIIWQNYIDSTGYRRGFDFNYLNPVIFYRPIEYSLGSPDNALIGANLKIILGNNIYLYGQLIIDDLDIGKAKKDKGYILNKYGYQGGVKAFDLFGVKRLMLQLEYNQVQPYVYAHKNPRQNYSHYNQPLAHPMGANFMECVAIVKYRWSDILFEAKLNYAMYGQDTTGSHWGKDIFQSDYQAQLGFPSYGNKLLQGVKSTLINADLRLSYIVNPKTNFNVTAGMIVRSLEANNKKLNYNLFYFGIRTSLNNLYYDF